MDDFIALLCPSCGGHIQVEKNLEKLFCTHCGTQLLLKPGSDGLLTPMIARDLTASARLKETQATAMMIDLLRTRIRELEWQTVVVRKAFFAHCLFLQMSRFLNPMGKIITRYEKSQGVPRFTYGSWMKQDVLKMSEEALARTPTPGFNTAEELFRLYQLIIQPEGYDKDRYELAKVLQPIAEIWPELQKKQVELKRLLDSLTP